MTGAAVRQRGVALIVALLVVALATVLIAALLDRGGLASARTRNTLRETQAEFYAKGLEGYAAHVLNKAQDQDSKHDYSDSIWSIPLPPTPVPGGQIAGTMTDLNGRFNLNNLAAATSTSPNVNQPAWTAVFDRLLVALKLDPNLEKNVTDWMSNSSSAGDTWYVAQPTPYRAAKRLFAHVSELRLIKGFDGDTYAKILPYVTALPVGTTINVNTASVPVLMTMTEGMTEQAAATIWQQGHAHLQDLSGLQIQYSNLYSTGSSYFLARCDITLDGLSFTYYSLIERNASGSTGAAVGNRVLLRNRGGD